MGQKGHATDRGCGMSERQVRRTLRQLEKAGFLTIKPGQSKTSPTAFTIHWDRLQTTDTCGIENPSTTDTCGMELRTPVVSTTDTCGIKLRTSVTAESSKREKSKRESSNGGVVTPPPTHHHIELAKNLLHYANRIGLTDELPRISILIAAWWGKGYHLKKDLITFLIQWLRQGHQIIELFKPVETATEIKPKFREILEPLSPKKELITTADLLISAWKEIGLNHTDRPDSILSMLAPVLRKDKAFLDKVPDLMGEIANNAFLKENQDKWFTLEWLLKFSRSDLNKFNYELVLDKRYEQWEQKPKQKPGVSCMRSTQPKKSIVISEEESNKLLEEMKHG